MIHPSISIFRWRCCPCPMLWGWPQFPIQNPVLQSCWVPGPIFEIPSADHVNVPESEVPGKFELNYHIWTPEGSNPKFVLLQYFFSVSQNVSPVRTWHTGLMRYRLFPVFSLCLWNIAHIWFHCLPGPAPWDTDPAAMSQVPRHLLGTAHVAGIGGSRQHCRWHPWSIWGSPTTLW